MTIKCPYCGNTLELQDGEALVTGQHVLCPFCNQRFVFGESPRRESVSEEPPDYPNIVRMIERCLGYDSSLGIKMPWLYAALKIISFLLMTVGGFYWLQGLCETNGVQSLVLCSKGFLMVSFGGVLYILLSIWMTLEKPMRDVRTLVRLKRRELSEQDARSENG
jgi:hypothetical protein